MVHHVTALPPMLEAVPAFAERPPWWGGDLQTLRNWFFPDGSPLPGQSRILTFPTSDGSGDTLIGSLETPHRNVSGPLIILIHGLTGCTESAYIRQTARYHLTRGRQILRLNLRGAGASNKSCSQYYHAGRASDLNDVLGGLDAEMTERGLVLIGFSLGGNILLNFLGGDFEKGNVFGAATVSAPIIPIEAARRLMAPRNWLYHAWLLGRMKQDYLGLRAQLSTDEKAAITNAKTIYAFDNDVIAPRNGFADAPDYYAKTAGMNVLNDISVPTLMIHAENDPWIPATPYRELVKNCPKPIEVHLAPGGGHVGFHATDSHETWHDRVIGEFIEHSIAGS